MDVDLFVYYLFSDGDYNYLWLFAILSFLVIGILHFTWTKKIEVESARKLLMSYGFYSIMYAIDRICFLFANYYYENGMEETSAFMWYTRGAYIAGLLGIAFILYHLEMSLLKTKGLLSSLPIITMILVFTVPYDIFRYVTYLSFPVYITVILSLYIKLIRQASGVVRERAIKVSLGIFLQFMGVLFDTRLSKDLFTQWGLREVVFIGCPVLVIIGIIVMYRANIANYSQK